MTATNIHTYKLIFVSFQIPFVSESIFQNKKNIYMYITIYI